MSTAQSELEVEGLHLWRGDLHLLRGVSFALGVGELLIVAGANGSGKTTLLRVVCGLTRADEGEVRWRGMPLAQARSAYQAHLAYVGHEPALKADLSALENLRFAVGLRRPVTEAALQASLERTAARRFSDLPIRALSAGQRRRVALARVLALQASLWVLDEPFVNLDAAGVALLDELLAAHLRAGGSALLVAHELRSAWAGVRRLALA